jgi:carboxyl-terminal processing protease
MKEWKKESKRYIRDHECSFRYSIDESFNTDYDKHLMQKNTAELERWRKQIVGTFFFDGAFEVQENKKGIIDTVATAKSRDKIS